MVDEGIHQRQIGVCPRQVSIRHLPPGAAGGSAPLSARAVVAAPEDFEYNAGRLLMIRAPRTRAMDSLDVL